jgi:hypothetical protein
MAADAARELATRHPRGQATTAPRRGGAVRGTACQLAGITSPQKRQSAGEVRRCANIFNQKILPVSSWRRSRSNDTALASLSKVEKIPADWYDYTVDPAVASPETSSVLGLAL